MSEQIKPSNEQEPLIPPRYLLILSALGFLVALIVKATQPEFSVVGYGGLAFGVLALLMWVLLAPDQARGVLTGRTARFGGTSLLVTVLLLAVLIGVYAVVRNANLRVDLTQTDTYSLTPELEQAIAALAAEPGTPKVEIVAFYGPSQASSRDQDSLLFEDYKQVSNGKIDYQFIDPEQQPQTVSQYGVSRAGQIAVVKLNDDGSPDTQNAQIVNTFKSGRHHQRHPQGLVVGRVQRLLLDRQRRHGGQDDGAQAELDQSLRLERAGRVADRTDQPRR